MPVTQNSDSLVTRNLTVEDALSLAEGTILSFQEMPAPAAPPTGSLVVYAKSDGRLYAQNDGGNEYELTVGKPGFARILYVESPKAGDEFPIGYVPESATLTAVRAITDAGTVDFNIEKRGKLTPGAAGVRIWSADRQATAAGVETISFDVATIDADEWLVFTASAVGMSPVKLWVALDYTID